MRYTILTAVTIFLMGIATPAAAEPQDIDRVTDGIERVYQELATLKASFVQETQLELLGKSVVKRGEMIFKRPGKFVIRYTTPPLKHYISNGKTLWIAVPEEGLVQESSLKKEGIDGQARVFLEGLGTLKRSFLISALSREGARKALFKPVSTLVYLELIPTEESPFYASIAVAVDPTTSLVTEMTLFSHSQNVSHYTFDRIQKNPAVDDAMFMVKQ